MGLIAKFVMLVNQTDFSADCMVSMDQHCRQFVVVVVKATFDVPPNGEIRLADEQSQVKPADEYYGEPGASSVRYESDVAQEKPLVDLIVNGQAVVPHGRKAGQIVVSMRVGEQRKDLLVSGDRFWRLGPLGRVPSSPQPFERLSILYERAFGGMDTRATDPAKRHTDARNPVGVGYKGAISQNPAIGTEVANIEHPETPIKSHGDRPKPAGFGIIAPNWEPRIGFAGTYDDAWKAEQYPLVPLDFDSRFFQAAPADQQSSAIFGGEQVEIINMTPEGTWRFVIPTLDVPIRLRYLDRGRSGSLRLDTVLIEPDSYRLTLTARSKIALLRNQAPLKEIVLGHVSRGWWIARFRDKVYLDHKGNGGRPVGITSFRV